MSILVSLLILAVPVATPLLLACLGGIISERTGVLNLGIEGLMAIGALTAVIFAISIENLWIATIAAVIFAAIISLIFAFLTITLKADQVVSGVMIALFGVAITNFYGSDWSGTTIDTFERVTIPIVGDHLTSIPYVGEILFYNTPLDYLALLLVPTTWYLLFRTRPGLQITAVGNNAKAADTEGINPIKVRYLGVIVSGAFAGLAGAALSLGFTGYWTANLIDSRGWIAIALVIVARWDPLKGLIGAYAFGLIYSMQFSLQNTNYENFPLSEALSGTYSVIFDPIIISTYPFVATIIMLIVFSIGTRTDLVAPQEIAKTYFR